MKFLKGFALGLSCFLLFPSILVFGFLFTINSTALNPDFFVSELDKLDVSSLTEEVISQQAPEAELPEELKVALVDTIARLEPVVKEQIGVATHSTFDYLRGKRENPDLALTLGDTFFSSDFVVSLMDELDMPLLVEEFIGEQMPEEEFPEEFRTALIDTITELEPQIKEQVALASDPIFDYLLGESQSLDLALVLHDTVLSRDFFASVVDKLDMSSIAKELLIEQLAAEIPEGMEEVVEYASDAITEEWLEEQLNTAIPSVLDYLLGESESLNVVISLEPVLENLEDSLREYLLESPPAELEQGFKEFLVGQITEGIPEEVGHLVDDAITDEWAEEQVDIAFYPVLNYLLGESESLSVVISLEPVVENLKDAVKEEFMESPPSELADLPPAQLEQYFDEYFQELVGEMPLTFEVNEALLGADIQAQMDELFQELTGEIPSTFVIDESILGEMPSQIADALAGAEEELGQVRQNIAEAIAGAEEGLVEARRYVGYFQLGYRILIGLILLLLLGIILIDRRVKSITRRLGIPFLVYGAIEYGGIFVAKYFARTQMETQLAQLDVPAQLQGWLTQLIGDFLAPLEMFSLGLLIAGVALIIVSFVYKRRQP